MLNKIAMFDKNENFKVGNSVILRSDRFKHIAGEIKELEEKNRFATVVTAEGETYRVHYDEMNLNEPVDVSDLSMNSVKQENEYRPVGRGYGQEREAFNTVALAMKKLEKDLGKVRMPIIAVTYESTEQRKWHNGLNALWEGDINFKVDFLDPNGVRHSATVRVPIQAGQVKQAEYIYDNLNRKYNLDKDGILDFFGQVNYIMDENKDESVFTIPGMYPATALQTNISFTKTADAKTDNKTVDIIYKNLNQNPKPVIAKNQTITAEAKWKMAMDKFAQNPLQNAKQFLSPEDYQELKKLLALRSMYEAEVKRQEDYNEQRGYERGYKVNYKNLNNINQSIQDILMQKQLTIKNHFFPEEIAASVDRVMSIVKKSYQNTKQANVTNIEFLKEFWDLAKGDDYETYEQFTKENHISPHILDLYKQSKNFEEFMKRVHSFESQASLLKQPHKKSDTRIKDIREDLEEGLREPIERIDVEYPYQKVIDQIIYDAKKWGTASGKKLRGEVGLDMAQPLLNILMEKDIRDIDQAYSDDDVLKVRDNMIDEANAFAQKQSSLNKKAEDIDADMIHEKEEDETVPYKKKKTRQKEVQKEPNDMYQGVDAPVPSGIGTRDSNDMSPRDPESVNIPS